MIERLSAILARCPFLRDLGFAPERHGYRRLVAGRWVCECGCGQSVSREEFDQEGLNEPTTKQEVRSRVSG